MQQHAPPTYTHNLPPSLTTRLGPVTIASAKQVPPLTEALLFKATALPHEANRMFNFTYLALQLNELTDTLLESLPPTDSRCALALSPLSRTTRGGMMTVHTHARTPVSVLVHLLIMRCGGFRQVPTGSARAGGWQLEHGHVREIANRGAATGITQAAQGGQTTIPGAVV